MSIDFRNQVVVVTGAGRGLGRAYAMEFARLGAHVVVNDPGVGLGGECEAASPADAVVREIEAAGGTAIADYTNVTQADAVEQMVARVLEKWQRIDVLVNNAGNMRKLVFSQTAPADLASMLSTHVMGSFLTSRAVWPTMVKQGFGRIVLTTSQVGMYGQLDAAAYGAAKMAVLGLMHGMKLEAAEVGIQVNCIAPFALTRMASGTFPDEIAAMIDPAVVAPAVLYLASRSCSLNGEVLIAGGGHFAMARSVETVGIDVVAADSADVDYLASRFDEIARNDVLLSYDDAIAAVQPTFDRLTRSDKGAALE